MERPHLGRGRSLPTHDSHSPTRPIAITDASRTLSHIQKESHYAVPLGGGITGIGGGITGIGGGITGVRGVGLPFCDVESRTHIYTDDRRTT